MSTIVKEGTVYQQLNDSNVFNTVYVEHGTVAWSDVVDIDPDTLYRNSISISERVWF